MKILIQAPRLVDPRSPFHLKEKNVLIHNGRIAGIGDKTFQADKTIKAEGMYLSTGWFDLGTFIGDPGLEHKEDLESGTKAAQAGGFTGLALMPNTHPSVQSKNEIGYLVSRNEERLVQVYPMAAVTKNNQGEDLTEMIDMAMSGALAFTDGLKPIQSPDILLKTLLYLKKTGSLLVNIPEDIHLNRLGQMHEGVNSTMLGLKGMPRLSEETALSRNLDILAYTGGRLHLSRLSSGRSMDLVRNARKKVSVTCDIAAYQPLLDDSALLGFDTNYKVNPPLREKTDNDALIRGLKEGIIDVICSGHVPQDEESKNIEFDLAEFGMINLQTFASNLTALSKHVPMEVLLEKVTDAPRKLLGLALPSIAMDEMANLTLFDPEKAWVLDDATNFSKAKNSPWYGKEIRGKSLAVFNKGKHWIDTV